MSPVKLAIWSFNIDRFNRFRRLHDTLARSINEIIRIPFRIFAILGMISSELKVEFQKTLGARLRSDRIVALI